MIHHGDWTTLTEGQEDLRVYCDYFVPNPGEDYNIEVIGVVGKKDDHVKSFIRRLRSFKSVKIIDIERISWGRYYLVLLGSYRSSIRRILIEGGAIITHMDVINGVERFEVLMPLGNNQSVKDLRDKISSSATLIHFEAREYNIPAPPRPLETLTSLERKMLTYAYSAGFFESPRRIKLEDIARTFGVTKATANYHLRNSIKKILDHVIGEEIRINRNNIGP
ncbi:MAG: helix-turn-helix domain-containing protein [Sulfolobales archaeon]